MKHLKRLMSLTSAAVICLAFVGAADALAFTVWRDNGVNITTNENATTKVKTGSSVKFTDSATGITVTCTTGSSGGTVGASGADAVSSASDTGCSSSNTLLCTNPVTANGVNLGWITQISGTRDNITPHSGATSVGWQLKCNNGTTVTCTSASSSVALTNDTSVSPNGVDGTFDASTPNASCSDGGTGTIRGTTITTLNSGHNLSVA